MAKGTDDTIAVRISKVLADRIISGTIEPGARLRQDHIAEEFHTSHVPVREAFRRLEAQGLAVSEPRRGVRVAAFNLGEVKEVAEMRAALEVLALRHAAPHLTSAILDLAEEATKAGDKPAMGANIASPYSILKASKNQEASAKLIEFLTTDKKAVADQLEVDGNFRDGYEYDMTPLGEELLKIVADTPASDYTPTGGGYGERTMPDGFSGELNTQTQALMGGTPAADVIKSMDAWFAANAG